MFIEIKDLNKINVFVGKNNSSKTSILEAIFLLTGISNAELILRIDQYRKLVHTEENDFRFVFYNLKYQNIPELEADMYFDDSSRKLVIKPTSTYSKNSDAIELSLSRLETASDSASSLLFESINSLTLEGEIKKRHAQKKIIRSSITIERSQPNKFDFTIKPPKDYKEELSGIFLNDQISFAGTHKRIEQLIIQKKKSFILENLRLIDSSIIDVSTGSNNMIYFDIGAERLLPSNLLGDGVAKILSIIASLNELKNGILIIDEIDNGLHYSALEILWKLIFQMCLENNNQLFITTHNYEVLKYLVKFINSNKKEKYADIVNCYSLAKIPGNELKSYKYNFEELSYSISNNIEIRGNESI